MAICYERFGSRASQGDESGMQIETTWVIEGTGDDSEARLLLLNTSGLLLAVPDVATMLSRRDFQLRQIGYDTWEATVNYATPGFPPGQQPQDPNVVSFTFDTMGGTAKITQTKARTTYKVDPAGPDAPDLGGAIGVTKDSVEGVEIPIPDFVFSETRHIPASQVTVSYVDALARMRGKVNQGAWRVFEAEQVLFLGATGTSQEDGLAPITYHFHVGEHITDEEIAGASGVDKKAWDYLWVMYEDAADEEAKKVVKRPKWVFVDRVHDKADFSILGI